MTEQELKAIVESIVRQILAGKAATAASAKPRVLLLMTGSEQSFDRTMEFIRALREPFSIKAYVAACYLERYTLEPLIEAVGCKDRVYTGLRAGERDALADEAQAGCLLLPLRTTLAKAARGFADSQPGPTLMRLLMAGKPVFCAGGEADPNLWPDTMPAPMRHGQGSLGESVEKDLAVLESWGLTYRRDPLELMAPLREALSGRKPAPAVPAAPPLVKAATVAKREWLTADDVRAAHASGRREIRVTDNVYVTDEARDVAAALYVSIIV